MSVYAWMHENGLDEKGQPVDPSERENLKRLERDDDE